MAEPIPKKQRIITALDTRLKTILTTGGYLTNIGQHVFDHKATPWQAEEIPGVGYQDTDNPEQLIGLELHRLDIECEAVIAGGTAGENKRKIEADITTMVGVDRTWGGLAEETSAVTAQPATVKIGEYVFSGARLKFTIEYVTDNMNAFS